MYGKHPHFETARDRGRDAFRAEVDAAIARNDAMRDRVYRSQGVRVWRAA